MRALNLLRSAPHYRREAFHQGLQAAGYKVLSSLPDPRPGDALLIWNRYGSYHDVACQWEQRGATVLVAENCPLGNDWRTGHWYSLAKTDPAIVGGVFVDYGGKRWDVWSETLQPMRQDGGILILGQRGIGHSGTASPAQWAESIQAKHGGRIRQHPGTRIDVMSLEDDLRDIGCVYTWASSAAIRAMRLGVRVKYMHPGFVMRDAAVTIGSEHPQADNRLRAFQRLAWCMWELEEIRNGDAIRAVVGNG